MHDFQFIYLHTFSMLCCPLDLFLNSDVLFYFVGFFFSLQLNVQVKYRNKMYIINHEWFEPFTLFPKLHIESH